MGDDQIVQDKGVEEATPPLEVDETSTPKPTEPDKLAELEKRLMATLEEKERHWQSVKDREVKSAKREAGDYRRRAEQSETILESLRNNPNMRVPLATAEQSARAMMYTQQERAQAEEQAKQEFFDTLEDHVNELGIDRADQRIDWGRDAKDIKEANRRFHKSLAKIQKEDSSSIEERILKKIRSEQEEEKARQRQEDGIDSVDTTVSGGAGTKKNYDKLYAEGDITWAEYNKLTNK